jgi:hypothetical protein
MIVMKNTTKSLFAGLVMLGSLGISTAEAFASGTPQSGIYLTNPAPNWYTQHPVKIPPTSEWGRIVGRIVPANPAESIAAHPNNLVPVVEGLMQWTPIPVSIGSYAKPKNEYYWGWYPTWKPLQFPAISSSGYFSIPAPPGRYAMYFSGENPYIPNQYNGQPNGAGNWNGATYASPTGFRPPATPFMFTVKAHQTVRLVTTHIFSTQLFDYHAKVSGARSQLDIFGEGFDPTSTVTTDAPGVTFTKSIFTSYQASWSDQRVRTTLVMGPGTHVGTYLLNVKSVLGTATTTMTIYQAPGSKVFSARFGIPFNYAQN